MSLTVVTSLHDLQLNVPQIINGNDIESELDGLGLNKPTYRKSLIYQRLKQLEQSKHISFVHVQEPMQKELTKSIANSVHTQGFLQFFDDAWKEWSQLVKQGNADSYMSLVATRSADDNAYEMFVPGQIAPRDLILTDKNGKGFVLSRPGKSILARICYYALDRLTPISSLTHTHLLQDLEVVSMAVDCLFKYATERNGNLWGMEWSSTTPAPFIYALTTQPGHHAGPESFGGYCYINNAAVTASLLSNSLKSWRQSFTPPDSQLSRIGVLDIDYHGLLNLFIIAFASHL
jgi:acetoin utilization deacetylase AcuC-like enzyme